MVGSGSGSGTTSLASAANYFSRGSILIPPAPTPRVDHVNMNKNKIESRIKALRSSSARNKLSRSPIFTSVRGNNKMVNEGEKMGVAVTSVPVRVAYELLLAGHRYLDVRTPEEFTAGHAPGAVNVPYMYAVGSGISKNPHFLQQVSSHFRKDDEIIVGCQSGKRSMMAATHLLAHGFSCITDIAGGHAAWSHNSLPMEL